MNFQDFCLELQRRLPFQIQALHVNERAVVSMCSDPEGMFWQCAIDLARLVQVETLIAARAVALKAVTVH